MASTVYVVGALAILGSIEDGAGAFAVLGATGSLLVLAIG